LMDVRVLKNTGRKGKKWRVVQGAVRCLPGGSKYHVTRVLAEFDTKAQAEHALRCMPRPGDVYDKPGPAGERRPD
jgi:hypothetical protein